MKILFANKFFFFNGGSERVFFQERGFLKKQGVDVVDFSMEHPRNFPSPYAGYFVSHIDYHNTKGAWGKLKQAAKFIHSSEAVHKIEKLIKKESPDIAHLHNIYHQLTPSIIPMLKKHGVKVVLTLHDGKLICPGYNMLSKGRICVDCQGHSFWRPLIKNCQGSRFRGLLLTLEAYWHKWKKSYEGVDLFISPSRFLADLVSRYRIPKERIQVLRNGIDTAKFLPSMEDGGYVLYFGRLSHEKGITTLLKAHQSMAEPLPLKVVGTGPLEKKLRASYEKAEFLGYKSGEELNRLIANATFVVVPSEWYENCSMVVLEAMAFGKPVIGSKIGGIPEQIEDGKTGLLFEMGNMSELAQKMKKLSSDREMRIQMGRRARRKLESEYSLDKHCKKLLSIYRALLK
ncbi:MAG: glycosyltransferase [Nitrospiraceae bacterium]|nr:glycosyltransferase [Nitrospiraceae bacterium]